MLEWFVESSGEARLGPREAEEGCRGGCFPGIGGEGIEASADIVF